MLISSCFCHVGVYMTLAPYTIIDRERVVAISGRSQCGGFKASKTSHSKTDHPIDKLFEQEF